MIRFALKCTNDHSFESWFQSSSAFDSLKAAGMVTCPACQSSDVEKELMAPRVTASRKKAAAPVEPSVQAPAPQPMSSTTDPEVEKAIKALRDHVEKNSDYVGGDFAKEARAMHDGDKPHRAIYGEAKPDDARKLLEDGVPVAPLPFTPKARTN